MGHYRYLVFTDPVEGREAEYNEWYDTIHLAEVIAVPGFVAAERYQFEPGENQETRHKYLAIYEFTADDPAIVLGELSVRAADGRLNMVPVLADNIETRLYKVITPRKTR